MQVPSRIFLNLNWYDLTYLRLTRCMMLLLTTTYRFFTLTAWSGGMFRKSLNHLM
jgi:hypothetical protein